MRLEPPPMWRDTTRPWWLRPPLRAKPCVSGLKGPPFHSSLRVVTTRPRKPARAVRAGRRRPQPRQRRAARPGRQKMGRVQAHTAAPESACRPPPAALRPPSCPAPRAPGVMGL